jgi:hypothetical protein
MLVITPLTFLGGAFYSIDMLPPAWRTFSLFNPIVYLISGFRWSFYGTADVPVGASLAATLAFFVVCLTIVAWIFKTGYRLKTNGVRAFSPSAGRVEGGWHPDYGWATTSWPMAVGRGRCHGARAQTPRSRSAASFSVASSLAKQNLTRRWSGGSR